MIINKTNEASIPQINNNNENQNILSNSNINPITTPNSYQDKKEDNNSKNNYTNKNALNLNLNQKELNQVQEEAVYDIELEDKPNPIFEVMTHNFNDLSKSQNDPQNNINEEKIVDNNIQNNINESIMTQNIVNQEILTRTSLQNYGQTSYLNAILQCLSNIVPLQDYFLNKDNFTNIKENVKKMPIAFVFQRVMYHFWVKKDKLYSLENFLRVLGKINRIYHNKKERNANECLLFILNCLNDELNKNKMTTSIIEIKNPSDKNEVINTGIRNYNNTYNSIIADIFNRFEIKEVECRECSDRKYQFNSYLTLQLDVLEYSQKNNKYSITLNDCLEFESNKIREMYCHKCKNQKPISNITKIYRSPKVLIFFLNNGEFDQKLLNIKFVLENKINLQKYINDQKSPKKYELNGIISIDINTKKYVSFCNSSDNQQWFYFYNETNTPINENQVIFNNDNSQFIPCILFYQSID